MRGKVLFFNEEKGFGKIIDSGKNEYFFYINKIKNKPEKINKDDEVEFEYYESPKGLRAQNIYFLEKIKCPVCNTMNYENDKNCKNIKCNWDLKYVKNGSFIGLSYKDIEEYNIKLNNYKNVYLNTMSNLHSTNLPIYSPSTKSISIKNEVLNNNTKIENRKIIEGKIIAYHEEQGMGGIVGEDSLPYMFDISDVDEPSKIQKNLLVNFIGSKDMFGFDYAKNIKIKNIERHIKHNLNIKIDKYDLNNDDLYIDRKELLMWKINPLKKMRWNDAINFVSDLLYAKHEDWRLPTVNELIKFFNCQDEWNIINNWGGFELKIDLPEFQKFWTSSDISKKMAFCVSFYTEGTIYDAWYDIYSKKISGIEFYCDRWKYAKEDKLPFFCVRDI